MSNNNNNTNNNTITNTTAAPPPVTFYPATVNASSRPAFLSLVEQHLTAVVREAVSVQRHAKRARIHHQAPDKNANANNASSLSKSSSSFATRRRLHAADVNMALQLMGSEKLYGTPVVAPDILNTTSSSTSTTEKKASKQKVTLLDVLRSEEMPPPPPEIALKYHWLAVDGTQPEIPQNPISSSKDPTFTAIQADQATAAVEEAVHTAGNIGSLLRVSQLQANLLSEELKLYFSRVTTAIERGQQHPSQQDAVLQSVSKDPGLQELVPFFVRYCQKELFEQIQINNGAAAAAAATEKCRTLVRLARSLLANPQLHLELHLHELLPALMTCVVTAQLCGNNSAVEHWSLRREAAMAVYEACQFFRDEYPALKPRVLQTLCRAIALPSSSSNATTGTSTATTKDDSNGGSATKKSLATVYGGIVGFTLFGSQSIDSFVLPMILQTWESWEQRLESPNLSPREQLELFMVQQASLNALGVYLQEASSKDKADRVSWEDLEFILRDRLVALLGEPNEYAMCFI